VTIQFNSAPFLSTDSARLSSSWSSSTKPTDSSGGTFYIPQLAQETPASSDSAVETKNMKSVEARLAEIKAKDAMSRTQEEQEFVRANDKKLAEITAQGKSLEELTAEELDYMQKATGFVNTMANLSPKEKALYNKAVASGDTEAAEGISQIALIRMMGHMARGTDGTTYDPLNTEITAANIEKYFRHSFSDPTGEVTSRFQALIRFMDENPDA